MGIREHQLSWIWSWNLIGKSCYHLKDKSYLDSRTYFITISLKDSDFAEGVAKRTYSYIENMFKYGKSVNIPNNRKPCMIVALDMNGSDYDEMKKWNYNPHIHILLTLPKSGDVLNDDKKLDLENHIRRYPEVHQFKSSDKQSVVIQKFDIARSEGGTTIAKKFSNIVAYSIKANVKDDLLDENLMKNVWLFPYDENEPFYTDEDFQLIQELENKFQDVRSHHKYFSKSLQKKNLLPMLG